MCREGMVGVEKMSGRRRGDGPLTTQVAVCRHTPLHASEGPADHGNGAVREKYRRRRGGKRESKVTVEGAWDLGTDWDCFERVAERVRSSSKPFKSIIKMFPPDEERQGAKLIDVIDLQIHVLVNTVDNVLCNGNFWRIGQSVRVLGGEAEAQGEVLERWRWLHLSSFPPTTIAHHVSPSQCISAHEYRILGPISSTCTTPKRRILINTKEFLAISRLLVNPPYFQIPNLTHIPYRTLPPHILFSPHILYPANLLGVIAASRLGTHGVALNRMVDSELPSPADLGRLVSDSVLGDPMAILPLATVLERRKRRR
ncbi:hypothetical protein C8F04DRAFT_1200667 [Mycena alexandri]|uniref:Uncharacterized protein n=1 Tax=Mycena alexandri TaxID=1745969 RepID=A0AAD6WLY0_9AGAR|nr:hypothetical protein C8F04DRAFT_1200667 [Mycena alexandri]